MGMTANEHQDDCRIFNYEGHDFLRLWGGVSQGVFPFMLNEVGELTDKNRLLVVVCESIVKPEEFAYAKWKGVGRPPADRLAIFKALLFKAVHDIPTTKELVERLKLEPQSRRLCGWLWPEDVPCESKFSEVNAEFTERGFTEKWFDDYVKTFIGPDGRKSVCYDSAPVPVRAKAANRRRIAADLEPDQPEAGGRLEWQAWQDADTALAELPQNCDWGTKRDAHGKPKHWKGGKVHAAVTDDGIPVAVAYTSASIHDSQAFIPLMKKASDRVPHVHDLADAAYDSGTVVASSVMEGNVPVIDSNRRKADEAPKMTAAERKAYKDRGNDERFFAHLIDAHGGRHVRVREPRKVWQHLMYGVLVIAVEQTMRSVMLC